MAFNLLQLQSKLNRLFVTPTLRRRPAVSSLMVQQYQQRSFYSTIAACSAQNNESSASGPQKSLSDVQFKGEDLVALKMRGLPWTVDQAEIEQFFSHQTFIRDSIKIGEQQDYGTTGQAAVLFDNEQIATSAMSEKQGKNVGSRWVELYKIPYSQYQSFEDDQRNQFTVNLQSFLNKENVSSCVKLRGLPNQATQQDVKNFFSDFSVADDDIVIEMLRGRMTGYALVFLNSEEEVKRARKELKKKQIRQSYIGVIVPHVKD